MSPRWPRNKGIPSEVIKKGPGPESEEGSGEGSEAASSSAQVRREKKRRHRTAMEGRRILFLVAFLILPIFSVCFWLIFVCV